jgi:hypothetical protein
MSRFSYLFLHALDRLNTAVATPIAIKAPPPNWENRASTAGRAIRARNLSASNAYAKAFIAANKTKVVIKTTN